MSPLYRKALVLGATSGIGAILTSELVATGTEVVAVGRRQHRLDALAYTYGADKLSVIAFDITRLSDIKGFTANIIR